MSCADIFSVSPVLQNAFSWEQIKNASCPNRSEYVIWVGIFLPVWKSVEWLKLFLQEMSYSFSGMRKDRRMKIQIWKVFSTTTLFKSLNGKI